MSQTNIIGWKGSIENDVKNYASGESPYNSLPSSKDAGEDELRDL
jgi:hypothetical protein